MTVYQLQPLLIAPPRAIPGEALANHPDKSGYLLRITPPDPARPTAPPQVITAILDGNPVWAEELPQGRFLSELSTEGEEARLVGIAVATTLQQMHANGQTHGALNANAVWITITGEALLLHGPGGTTQDDCLAWERLFGRDLDNALTLSPEQQQRLAKAVQKLKPRPPTGPGWIKLDTSFDEIQHSLIPEETDSKGILDRWGVVTANESTSEQTGSQQSEAQAMEIALWSEVTAIAGSSLPEAHFKDLQGVPSNSLRSLRRSESIESIQTQSSLRVPAFLTSSRTPSTAPKRVPKEDDTAVMLKSRVAQAIENRPKLSPAPTAEPTHLRRYLAMAIGAAIVLLFVSITLTILLLMTTFG